MKNFIMNHKNEIIFGIGLTLIGVGFASAIIGVIQVNVGYGIAKAGNFIARIDKETANTLVGVIMKD